MDRLGATLAVAFACLALSSACFITNCPTGGKRSIADPQDRFVGRQCSACGARGGGRCLGPRICCNAESGCRIGGGDSTICRAEELLPVPCDNPDMAPCGEREGFDGRCAAHGVCCSTERCVVDDSCRVGNQRSFASISRDFLPLLSAPRAN